MNEFLIVNSILVWVAIILNFILILAIVRRLNASKAPGEPQRPKTTELEVGQKAPDFHAVTLEGEPISLASYDKRPSAFVFVAPSCGPCIEALPSYETIAPLAAQAGVNFTLVSLADLEKSRSFRDEYNLKLPIVSAPRESNPFMKDYKILGTPSYCVINEQGQIEAAGYPSLDWGDWKRLAEKWASAVQPIN